MAYTTLNSLLKAIANAIRAKKGTTAQINAQNFPSEIASISDGLSISEEKSQDYKYTKLNSDDRTCEKVFGDTPKLLVVAFTTIRSTGAETTNTAKIYGSNDNATWEELVSKSETSTSYAPNNIIAYSNTKKYKYLKGWANGGNYYYGTVACVKAYY